MSSSLQRVMRQWDALHPFNMLVAVRVRGRLDEPALRVAVADEAPSASIAIRIGSEADYDRVASDELNTRIPPDAGPRLVVLVGPQGHIVVLNQPHQRMDGASAFAALVRVVSRYLGVGVPEAVPGRGGGAGAAGQARRGIVAWHRWPRMIAGAAAASSAFARCYRPASGSPDALTDSVTTIPVAADTRARVRALSRTVDGTANDVLVAALAEAVLSATRPARHAGSRRGVALALPVDLRAIRADVPLDGAGVDVSFINVVLSGEDRPFASLLGEVARTTAAARRTRSYATSTIEMWAASRLARWLAANERSRYFSRQRPYCGVLTSPRVPAAWVAPGLGGLCGGWRLAVSSGPMTPLVIAATVGPDDSVECTATVRRYGYRADEAAAVLCAFRNRLDALALTRAASSSCRGSA